MSALLPTKGSRCLWSLFVAALLCVAVVPIYRVIQASRAVGGTKSGAAVGPLGLARASATEDDDDLGELDDEEDASSDLPDNGTSAVGSDQSYDDYDDADRDDGYTYELVLDSNHTAPEALTLGEALEALANASDHSGHAGFAAYHGLPGGQGLLGEASGHVELLGDNTTAVSRTDDDSDREPTGESSLSARNRNNGQDADEDGEDGDAALADQSDKDDEELSSTKEEEEAAAALLDAVQANAQESGEDERDLVDEPELAKKGSDDTMHIAEDSSGDADESGAVDGGNAHDSGGDDTSRVGTTVDTEDYSPLEDEALGDGDALSEHGAQRNVTADDDGSGGVTADFEPAVDARAPSPTQTSPALLRSPASTLDPTPPAAAAARSPRGGTQPSPVRPAVAPAASSADDGNTTQRGDEPSFLRRLRKRPNERFLLLMNAAEGLTSWYHALYEMMEMARRLGRTLVEPCVRDGRIVVCVPGKVKSVPFGVADAPPGSISATTDPLALPSLVGCGAVEPAVPAGGSAKRRRRGRRRRLRVRRRGKKRAGRGGGAGFGLDEPQPPPSRAGPLQPGWSYPLHAYLDVQALRALYKHWVSFDDWFALEASRPDSEITRSGGGGRLEVPLGYCVGKTGADPDRLCDSPGVTLDLRPWSFRRMVTSWHVDDARGAHGSGGTRLETQHLKQNLRFLRGDASRSMFFFNVWRGAFDPVDTYDTLPPFNSVHAAAVRAWLGASIAPDPGFPEAAARGFGRYVAWQWRSETVKQDVHFAACAVKLASVAKEALRPLKRDRARAALLNASVSLAALQSRGGFDTRKAGSGGAGAGPPAPRVSVLVSDIPAPNNGCRLWGVYDASFASLPRRAVAKMMAPSVGMLKYDAAHPGLDAGVLSIRDFIVSTEADWFVTCKGRNGAECLGCFRAQSYFTRKIVDMRAAAGRRSLFNWFRVNANDLR